MRAALAMAIAALLPTIAGCSAIDVHFDDPAPRIWIQTVWQIQLDEPEPFGYYPKQTATPVYGRRGRIVVAGSDAGTLVAADSKTGSVLWRFDTSGKIRGAAVIDRLAVYFGGTDGKLYRLDLKTGAEDWEEPYSTKGAITSAPVVGGGKVIFQNNQNRTYAVDAATGTYVWDQGRPRPGFLTIKGEGGATIHGEHVFAGYDDGFLVKMRLSDGATEWSKNLAADKRQFIDVDTRPVVYRKLVYAACFGVGLYALNAEHGNIKWLHRARGVHTPAMGGRYLYLTTGDGRVKALDPLTGKLQWQARFDYGELAAPVFSVDRLWVPTGDGLVLMHPEQATVLARISPDSGQSAAISTSRGWIHMVTNSGSLVGARVF